MLSETTPLIIPTFNNPTFTKNFVEQSLTIGFKNIFLYNNNSTYPPMIKLLATLESSCQVLKLEKNFGPHYILRNPEVYKNIRKYFRGRL